VGRFLKKALTGEGVPLMRCRGSGEAFQLAFSGQGFLVVQASEGPVVPTHSHGSGGGGGLFS